MRNNRQHSAITVAQAITTTVVVVTLAAAIVLASEILLTLFLAVLFGVFLSRLAGVVDQWIPLGKHWSIAVVVATLLLLSGAAVSLFYIQTDQQIESASQQIDRGIARLRELADESPTVRSIVSSIPFVSESIDGESNKFRRSAPESQTDAESSVSDDSNQQESEMQEMSGLPAPVKQAVNMIGQVFRTTYGLVVNSMLIFFVGLFLALSPETYRDGVVKLVPPSKRERATEVMNEMGNSLWRWLIGRFGSMLATGVGAAVLMRLIGVPMSGSLGIITGLLTFIPNIGAAIALSISVLFALPQGATTAVMVIPAYIGLQLVESYVVTPLIQRRQVSIPPALLIAFQAVMGVLFGILGAAVASPLLAALEVGTRKLYVEDVLEADEVR